MVEHLPYDLKIEGLNPAIVTGREKMAKSNISVFHNLVLLSLTGALTRELALKADDPLTHDLLSTSQFTPTTSKLFLSKKFKFFCQHYLIIRQCSRLYPGSRVVEHSPYDPKIKGLSPATATGRETMAKSDISVFHNLVLLVSYWCANQRVSFKSR